MSAKSRSLHPIMPNVEFQIQAILGDFDNYKVNWGPIGAQIHKRSYSRIKKSGAQESWPETVIRAVDGNLSLVDQKFIEPDEREKLIYLMLEFGIIPAGRHLYSSGVEGRQFLFNCHCSAYDKQEPSAHFGFLFDELMQGGGVGANYSNRYVLEMPVIAKSIDLHVVCKTSHPNIAEFQDLLCDVSHNDSETHTDIFVIEDSREGWIDIANKIISTSYENNGKKEASVVVDVSNIRARGEPLKTSGGIACGPGPLVAMLHDLTKQLNSCIGRKLSSLETMTIDHILASCVIAGGKRRSSRMSVKNWKDSDIFEFINCKRQDGAHWSTNISVEIDDEFFKWYKSDDRMWGDRARAVMRAVILGKRANGEPGFWNRSLAMIGERKPDEMYSPNPCQPAWATLLTPSGIITMGEAKVGDIIWSGEQWTKIVRKIATGIKHIKAYVTKEGTFFGTENHRIISNGEKLEVKNAKSIDPANEPGQITIEPITNDIIKIIDIGHEPVFDITVAAEEHTYWTDGLLVSNCGEISFTAWENCCLGHINLQYFYNKPSMTKEAFRLMTRWLVRATFADIPQPRQLTAVKENRRIGVGFFGYHGWLALRGIKYSEAWKDEKIKNTFISFRQTVQQEAKLYAKELNIPDPVKNTTIAPTGTIALLPGVSTGCQATIYRYFKRLVRYASDDPEVQVRKSEGYEVFKDDDAKNTEIVTYYCEDPLVALVKAQGLDPEELVETQEEISLEESLNTQMMLQETYADNGISFTINLPTDKMPSEEEMEKLFIEALPKLKGTTVFPDKSRKNAPYQKLTLEEWNAYSGRKEVTQVEEECKTGCPTR